MQRTWVTLEGNEAVANVAHALGEVIAIYPITPSTPMGELADAWSAAERTNLWGTVSNTGGQASKSTPRGAVAKFAARGKSMPKKDLGLLAMAYGSIYVERVAMGANDQQTLRAFIEAEAYEGPSLIIAYSHCIAHGIEISKGLEQQKLAVQSGYWPLYRYDPSLHAEGKNPLILVNEWFGEGDLAGANSTRPPSKHLTEGREEV